MGSLHEHGIWLDASHPLHQQGLNAGQRFGCAALAAHHQHRGGIGGSQQAEAIGSVHAQAVYGVEAGICIQCESGE